MKNNNPKKHRFIKALENFPPKARTTFRSLRWRLTLSYFIVTISALVVVELIVIFLLMIYFVNNIDLTPETLISGLRAEWTPQMQQFFSEEPPNTEGFRKYLEDVQGSTMRTRPLFILGNLQLEMKAQDFLNFYYLLDDRTLVDVIPHDIVPTEQLGKKLPYHYLPGMAEPLRAALRGVEDEHLLYEKVEPGTRIVGAIPIFRFETTDIYSLGQGSDNIVMDVERNLVGVLVFATKRFPWEYLPLSEVMAYVGRSLMIFTMFAGIFGSVFGLITAGGLSKRLTRISKAAHDWSRGNFSVIVRDTSDDEVGKLSHDLNSMAEQLKNLLDRRLELTILEERNRLARDLHDSVKQQAFAASAQLGAARMRLEDNPKQAYSHLLEAEVLVGHVRQELNDLIRELRPVEMMGKGLATVIENYVKDWFHQNNIQVITQISGGPNLPGDVEKSLYRIVQEALANVARHSQAEQVEIVMKFMTDHLLLTIRDDGKGFIIDEDLQKGLGLKSMFERVALMGGEMELDSQIDLGTTIRIVYPYQKLEN